MIQASDLRLGNVVLDADGKYNEVVEIKQYFVVLNRSKSMEERYIPLESLRPVPLTEEVLLKCGFERLTHFTIGNSIIKDIGRGRHLSVQSVGTPNEFIALVDRSSNESTPSDIIIIKNYDYDGYTFLHTLQNIHHSLTGKELEVNL